MEERSISLDEMKALKFKSMIEDVAQKLGVSAETTNVKNIPGSKRVTQVSLLLGDKANNVFSDIILNRKVSDRDCPMGYTGGIIQYDGGTQESIEELLSSDYCSKTCSRKWSGCSRPGQTIFYALLALAVDNDLYDEKLEIVSDVAYLMGFNEDMMEDWTIAVKRFLLAKKLNSKNMKTEEARLFFSCLDE